MRRPTAAAIGTVAGVCLLLGARLGAKSPADLGNIVAEHPEERSSGAPDSPTDPSAPGVPSAVPHPPGASATPAAGSASRALAQPDSSQPVAAPDAGTGLRTGTFTGAKVTSGYVKGWAVQVASDRLTRVGVVNHCVNAGGDVRVRGRPAPDDEWRVGVRHPWRPRHLAWVLAGPDLAVATSGTYERGHHVIDPYRGEPAREICSVTVVGRDLGLADAYATAALAMGERAVEWLARLPGYESAVITADGRCFRSEGLPLDSYHSAPAGLAEP